MECKECHKVLLLARANRFYCCGSCSQAAYLNRKFKKYHNMLINKGRAGLIVDDYKLIKDARYTDV